MIHLKFKLNWLGPLTRQICENMSCNNPRWPNLRYTFERSGPFQNNNMVRQRIIRLLSYIRMSLSITHTILGKLLLSLLKNITPNKKHGWCLPLSQCQSSMRMPLLWLTEFSPRSVCKGMMALLICINTPCTPIMAQCTPSPSSTEICDHLPWLQSVSPPCPQVRPCD